MRMEFQKRCMELARENAYATKRCLWAKERSLRAASAADILETQHTADNVYSEAMIRKWKRET